MRRRLVAAAALLSVAVTGCAPTLWAPRLGQNEEDFKRAKYRCSMESETRWAGGGTGLVGIGVMAGMAISAQVSANNKYRMCMDAMGFTEVKK